MEAKTTEADPVLLQEGKGSKSGNGGESAAPPPGAPSPKAERRGKADKETERENGQGTACGHLWKKQGHDPGRVLVSFVTGASP